MATAGRAAGLSLVVVLAACAVAAPPATRATPAAASPVAWAYVGHLEGTLTGPIGGVQVAIDDQTSYVVLLTQTNLSHGSYLLEMERVLGTRSYLTACYPNCTDPAYAMTGASLGTEYENATLEIDTGAAVTLNGTTVPAYGLASEQLLLEGNLTVSFTWANLTDPDVAREEWFNASTAATSSGSFRPDNPLGLVPLGTDPNATWTSEGTVVENSTTSFEGAIGYQGDLLPANGSRFALTSSPISPSVVALAGADEGNASLPALAGDRLLSLAPTVGNASILEGALLVPTSAYLYAGFSSACDLAQRPCAANVSTPTLDFNASDPAHLGWEAATSSVSAFALRFGSDAIDDGPDGAAFWPAAAEVPGAGRLAGSGATAPSIVQAVPDPVPDALALAQSLHPNPASHSSTTPPPPVPLPLPGPRHGARGAGAAGGSFPIAVPASGGAAPPLEEVAIGVLGAAVVAGLAVGVARRRRPPRPRDPEETAPPPEGAAPPEGEPEDPMGYVY